MRIWTIDCMGHFGSDPDLAESLCPVILSETEASIEGIAVVASSLVSQG